MEGCAWLWEHRQNSVGIVERHGCGWRGVAGGEPARCTSHHGWLLGDLEGLKQESDGARLAFGRGNSGCSRKSGGVVQQGDLEGDGGSSFHPMAANWGQGGPLPLAFVCSENPPRPGRPLLQEEEHEGGMHQKLLKWVNDKERQLL